MRCLSVLLLMTATILMAPGASTAQKQKDPDGWRVLPLIDDGRIAAEWTHIGWGNFGIDKDVLRTDCDEKGMGLLVYKKERLGNCQIRVVYKLKDPKSNAGVYVRIDDGILKWENKKPTALIRDGKGGLTKEMLARLMSMSENKEGPWYAVHHGYEVQICDDADPLHRTGAIYSLAKAAPLPKAKADGWRTMIITLDGNKVLIDVDGTRITTFDSESKDTRKERKWFEPMSEPKRPKAGYIGLQCHDPGDVVYFKEVSVRPLK